MKKKHYTEGKTKTFIIDKKKKAERLIAQASKRKRGGKNVGN